MPKDTFWFSHDYNARNDRKIAALVREYKSAGYGIYWCTAEMLHEENGKLEFDDLTFGAIAKDLNEEPEFIKEVLQKCIDKFKLFYVSDNNLTASRVQKNLENKEDNRQIKSDAGRLGGIKSGETRQIKAELKQIEALLEANEAQVEANEPYRGDDIDNIPSNKVVNSKEDFNIKKEAKKKFNQFPTEEDIGIDLPVILISKIKEYYQINKNTNKTEGQIKSEFEFFKIRVFTGKKFYQNEAEVFAHFMNTIKNEKTEINGKYNGQYKNNSGGVIKAIPTGGFRKSG